jgi:hypothetical protein
VVPGYSSASIEKSSAQGGADRERDGQVDRRREHREHGGRHAAERIKLPLAVHKFCSMLPAFIFEARPVVPVMDAVRVELEAIAFRDELKKK